MKYTRGCCLKTSYITFQIVSVYYNDKSKTCIILYVKNVWKKARNFFLSKKWYNLSFWTQSQSNNIVYTFTEQYIFFLIYNFLKLLLFIYFEYVYPKKGNFKYFGRNWSICFCWGRNFFVKMVNRTQIVFFRLCWGKWCFLPNDIQHVEIVPIYLVIAKTSIKNIFEFIMKFTWIRVAHFFNFKLFKILILKL